MNKDDQAAADALWLEGLVGLGPIKQLKREQNQDDILSGKLAHKSLAMRQ